MAQREYGYEMQPRGQSRGYSGGNEDRYDMDRRGDRYGTDYGRDQNGGDPRQNQYGMDQRGGYGGDTRGNRYGMDYENPRDQYGMSSSGGQYGGGAYDQHFDMGDGQGVVTQQPGRMGFTGGGPSGVPPGLEYMAQVDQLLVQQKFELCEIFSGCETKNRYTVANTMGQEVYSSKENSGFCTRQCCGPIRPFDMEVLDAREVEVLHLKRPLRCQGCCCPCCLQQLEVTTGGGQLLGTIRERWTICKPKLTVHQPDGQHVFTIRGPICKCSCCGDVHFRILTADDEQEVGMIRKQWSGLLREVVTDSDTFGVTFPMDLDVGMKATLFGALFLVDFMFFERSNS